MENKFSNNDKTQGGLRILQFCNKSPYPPKEGGPIAMNAITNMLLKQGHSVTVLGINTYKYFVNERLIDDAYKEKTNIELVWLDIRFHFFSAILSLTKNSSYHVDRFKSEILEQRLKELLIENNFDIVIMETVYLAIYADIIRKYSSAKLILRAHNVEHSIWNKIAKNTSIGLKKIYFAILAGQLKRFEQESINLFDAIFCISATDKVWFSAQNSNKFVDVIPFGIDVEDISNNIPAFHCDNLFSIASMNWYPNIEAIEWFLNNVWDKINRLYPTLILKIAGRNIPDSIKNTKLRNVDIVGVVYDAKKFMRENGVLIVPLMSGSGIRIKIIEAMAMGKVIITTSIGLDGILAKDKEHILIADTVDEFVNAVKFCIENTEACEQIGKNAQKFVRENHNNIDISSHLKNNLNEIYMRK